MEATFICASLKTLSSVSVLGVCDRTVWWVYWVIAVCCIELLGQLQKELILHILSRINYNSRNCSYIFIRVLETIAEFFQKKIGIIKQHLACQECRWLSQSRHMELGVTCWIQRIQCCNCCCSGVRKPVLSQPPLPLDPHRAVDMGTGTYVKTQIPQTSPLSRRKTGWCSLVISTHAKNWRT